MYRYLVMYVAILAEFIEFRRIKTCTLQSVKIVIKRTLNGGHAFTVRVKYCLIVSCPTKHVDMSGQYFATQRVL